MRRGCPLPGTRENGRPGESRRRKALEATVDRLARPTTPVRLPNGPWEASYMRGLTRPLDVALATSPAVMCIAAGLVAALAGALLLSPSAACAQQASPATSRQAHEKETGMLHWGTTVVWFRAM